AEERPIALVLPSLYSEIHGPALKRIVEELIQVPYLTQCVLSLSGPAGPAEYREFRALVEPIRSMDDEPATVIWNQGPRIQALIQRLRDEGLDPGSEGKGRANWLAYGYVLATHRARVVATHDCDILDYDRDLLARLVFPTANPNMSYEFAKGYYSRVSDRMHGRVTRLFMTPLIRAMKSVLGPVPLLDYLESFRYPLAGECSMTTELIRANRIPADWGLEVGVLAEVYRNCSLKRICQVELVENYDHKHQDLSEHDGNAGLHRMVRDIAASLIRNLASYGVEFDSGFLNTLIAAYVRTAQDAIARYSDDAKLNGLYFDRHEEEVAVETFSGALRAAGLDFVRDPMGAPQIPNWSRVVSALPDFLDELAGAVVEDAEEAG
ncbi:MAG: glycosyl transferase, partial [bacterium]